MRSDARLTTGAAGNTAIVTDLLVLPPVPAQVNVMVTVLANPLKTSLPDVVLVPLQPSEAVQLVALVLLQVSVDDPLIATELGLAARVTVGIAAITATLTDWLALPPAPVQVSV